jgi:hypothetical protein
MMFSKRLMEVCEQATIAHVEQLFDRNRAQSSLVQPIPYIGNMYRTDGEKDVAWLKQRVVAALLTRRWFDMTKPPWAGELPLTFKDIGAAERSGCPRCKLVGYFSSSVRGQGWAWKLHPPFATYCSGLLACGYTPEGLQEESLRMEFPPRRLPGLADGDLTWRPAAQIAEERQAAAWIYEMEERINAGGNFIPLDQWRCEHMPYYVGRFLKIQA